MITIKLEQTKLESITIEYTAYQKDKDRVNKILSEVLRDISHNQIQLVEFRWGFIDTKHLSEFTIEGKFFVEKCIIDIYQEKIVVNS
jgi:hypothetical protein